jgi:hypothetical protein
MSTLGRVRIEEEVPRPVGIGSHSPQIHSDPTRSCSAANVNGNFHTISTFLLSMLYWIFMRNQPAKASGTYSVSTRLLGAAAEPPAVATEPPPRMRRVEASRGSVPPSLGCERHCAWRGSRLCCSSLACTGAAQSARSKIARILCMLRSRELKHKRNN